MLHKTLNHYQEAVRQFCRECQQTKKLVSSHCTASNCVWFDDRKSLLERHVQTTLFTSNGFYQVCLDFLAANNKSLLNQMWWSDIRLTIESYLDSIRAKKPSGNQLNWWGHLSKQVYKAGFVRTDQTRISPINGASECLYVKRIIQNG